MKYSVSSCIRLFRSTTLVLMGILLVGLLGSGCGSSGPVRQGGSTSPSVSEEATSAEQNEDAPSQEEASPSQVEDPVKVLRVSEVSAELKAAADDWYGTPYKWGGSSQQGVDCSGFVKNLYEEAFSYSLPRVTETQLQVGDKVGRDQLQAGDLVFFRPEDEYNHVGVYVGDGTFLHAASSEGVTETEMDNTYWQKYYWTSRRPLTVSKLPDSLRSKLVAYKYPDTSRGSVANPQNAGDEAADEAETSTTTASTGQIASCSDPEIECGDPEGTTATADTEQRKGW